MSHKMFQIHEQDLAELEHLGPELQDALLGFLEKSPGANRVRVQLRRIKDIISNVRWDYGPPSEVLSIPGGPE